MPDPTEEGEGGGRDGDTSRSSTRVRYIILFILTSSSASSFTNHHHLIVLSRVSAQPTNPIIVTGTIGVIDGVSLRQCKYFFPRVSRVTAVLRTFL